jgi:hypothetical protein
MDTCLDNLTDSSLAQTNETAPFVLGFEDEVVNVCVQQIPAFTYIIIMWLLTAVCKTYNAKGDLVFYFLVSGCF